MKKIFSEPRLKKQIQNKRNDQNEQTVENPLDYFRSFAAHSSLEHITKDFTLKDLVNLETAIGKKGSELFENVYRALIYKYFPKLKCPTKISYKAHFKNSISIMLKEINEILSPHAFFEAASGRAVLPSIKMLIEKEKELDTAVYSSKKILQQYQQLDKDSFLLAIHNSYHSKTALLQYIQAPIAPLPATEIEALEPREPFPISVLQAQVGALLIVIIAALLASEEVLNAASIIALTIAVIPTTRYLATCMLSDTVHLIVAIISIVAILLTIDMQVFDYMLLIMGRAIAIGLWLPRAALADTVQEDPLPMLQLLLLDTAYLYSFRKEYPSLKILAKTKMLHYKQENTPFHILFQYACQEEALIKDISFRENLEHTLKTASQNEDASVIKGLFHRFQKEQQSKQPPSFQESMLKCCAKNR